MKTLFTIQHALIIILLFIGCFDSYRVKNERDAGREENEQDSSGEENERDAGVRNECEEEKEIRLEAIHEKCAEPNLVGCCYCSCELTGEGTGEAGCSCLNWQLTSTEAVTPCEGGALPSAMNCVAAPAICAEQTKTVVALYCN